MPLCVSCRGEYCVPPAEEHESREHLPSETTSPSLDELLSAQEDQAAGMTPPSPVRGGEEEWPPYICSRCGVNNERWHRWATASGGQRFTRFFLHSVPWGWLTLFSFLLPGLALLFADSINPIASVVITVLLAWILIFVNVALLYALKDLLWRREVLVGVAPGFRPHLASMAVTAFVLALIFGLVIGFMVAARADASEMSRSQGLARVAATILLAFTFVNVTLSAIFMAGHDFSNWLDREMPQPIYAQEGRLLDVIRKGVQAKINQANGKKDGEIQTTIADMERTNDGGVVLIVRAEIDADEKGFKKLQDWKITTDRWGGIRKMSQAGPLRYVKGPVRDDSKDDRGDKKGDDDQKISPDTNSEPPWHPNYRR